MIGQDLDSNTLRVLASTRQVRDADDRTRWMLGIRVGGPSAQLEL